MGYLIIFLILILVIAVVKIIVAFSNDCFAELDSGLFCFDQAELCQHQSEKTDVVINTCVTCETIHTICDNCGKILNVKIDCI